MLSKNSTESIYSATAFVASLSLNAPHMSPAPNAAFGKLASITGNGNTVVFDPANSFSPSGQNAVMNDACLCIKHPGLPFASFENIGS